MKSPTDVVSGFILLGLCGVGAYSVATLPDAEAWNKSAPAFSPRYFLSSSPSLASSSSSKDCAGPRAKTIGPEPKVFKKILIVLGLFYLYLITLIGLGDLFLNMEHPPFQANGAFSISTTLFLLILLPLLGRRKPVEIISVAILTTATLVFVFGWFFQVILP